MIAIPSLNFSPCSLKPANGYGKLEIALWSALAEIGVQVNPVGFIREEGADQLSLAAKLQTELDQPMPRPHHSLVIGKPYLGENWHLRNTCKWLYTMSESTRVSEEWVEQINRLFDGVIVPAPALVDIYKTSGVERPVQYVPMGITPPESPVHRNPASHSPFVFLTYSLGEMRKGAELAIQTFRKLFNGDPRYQLWIKTPADGIPGWLGAVANACSQIKLVSARLTEQEWFELLASVDCFVFPSRGEGFGLPPREATLVGTPTIATSWLGLHDVACWGLPIRVKEMRPAAFEGEANHPTLSMWAEPDIDDLARQMVHAVVDHDEFRRTAAAGQRYLRQFTWQRTALAILEVIGHAA